LFNIVDEKFLNHPDYLTAGEYILVKRNTITVCMHLTHSTPLEIQGWGVLLSVEMEKQNENRMPILLLNVFFFWDLFFFAECLFFCTRVFMCPVESEVFP